MGTCRRGDLNKILISIYFTIHFAAALAGSFCKRSSTASNKEPNFCFDVSTHLNTTTNTGDFHFHFTHDRYEGSALGWTAVGPGNFMDGSLMFVVFGDPETNSPTVSTRTANGHTEPFKVGEQSGIDIAIVSSWSSSSKGVTTATVDIDCYGCTTWTSTDISVTSPEQSFIWAFNAGQDFEGSYSPEVGLDMHGPPPNTYGSFRIAQKVENVGSSSSPKDYPKGVVISRLWMIHGLLSISAFIFLFPLGCIAIRCGSSVSFKYHWILQSLGTGIALIAIGLAASFSNSISSPHQYLGLLVGALLTIQVFLGYRHHVVFLRTLEMTWLSRAHVHLGRILVVGGLINVLLGLQLKGYHPWAVTATAIAEILEIIVIACVRLRWKNKRALIGDFGLDRRLGRMAMEISSAESAGENSFALAEEEDDDDDDESDRLEK